MNTRVTSMQALQELVPGLIKEIESDQQLLAATLANPLLALQELGIELDLGVAQALEDRARFGKKDIAVRRRLRKEIFDIAGRKFDLSDGDELDSVLTELDVKTTMKQRSQTRQTASKRSKKKAAALSKDVETPDPLEELVGVHPMVEPLVEYRRLDRGARSFASPEAYHELRYGETSLPITKLRMRLKKQ